MPLPTGFPTDSRGGEASNLPIQLTSFIGRDRELADVVGCMGSTRMLTLTGPGGCGKTRLALQAGSRHIRAARLPPVRRRMSVLKEMPTR
jgi:hypothetical protein